MKCDPNTCRSATDKCDNQLCYYLPATYPSTPAVALPCTQAGTMCPTYLQLGGTP
jgi:hypothetical protein